MNRVSVMGELVASLSHEITQPIASARIHARAAQNFLDMPSPDLGEVGEALPGICWRGWLSRRHHRPHP
jgi:C4-dicarboxylate-specific signal transduction histidine kinase